MSRPQAPLKIAVLTTPQGAATVAHLVRHLNVVGILVDEGPWGKPARKRSVWRRSKAWVGRILRHAITWISSRDGPMVNWADIVEGRNVAVVKVDNINSALSARTLGDWNVDLGVIVGGRIVKRPILDTPRLGVLNKHSSLLPRHRGLAAEYWCLYHEDFDALGLTVHFVDEGMDTGPIVVQKPMTFLQGDTPQSLRQRSEVLGRDVLVEAVRLIETTGTTGTPQDASKATVNRPPSRLTDRQLTAKLPALWKQYGKRAA